MKKIKAILFFVLLFSISQALFSQSYRVFQDEWKEIEEKTKFRIGPFKIFPVLQLRNIGYDDNVYYQKKEDHPVSDYTSTLSPEVRVFLLFRNSLIFSFSENPEYLFYLKEEKERTFTHSFSPRFRYLFLQHFVISGDYHYQMRRRRVSTEIDRPITDFAKGYSLSFFYETARKTSFGFSGTIHKITFEDIILPGSKSYLSQELDREERSGHFEFYYQIFSEAFFFYKLGYIEYNFEHPQSSWRNSYSYETYAGIRFPLLGRIRGTLSLGFKKFVPRKEEKKSFSGLVGNTSLDFKLGRFDFRLSYVRDNAFSYWAEILYFIENRYEGGISFYLTQFLRIDYNYQKGELSYPELIPYWFNAGNYEEIKRKDILHSHSVGFAFRIIRNTGIGLALHTFKRASNFPGLTVKRNFLGAYLTYEF
jgi:hypothetical protein